MPETLTETLAERVDRLSREARQRNEEYEQQRKALLQIPVPRRAQ